MEAFSRGLSLHVTAGSVCREGKQILLNNVLHFAKSSCLP